jgi:hypothetical protein
MNRSFLLFSRTETCPLCLVIHCRNPNGGFVCNSSSNNSIRNSRRRRFEQAGGLPCWQQSLTAVCTVVHYLHWSILVPPPTAATTLQNTQRIIESSNHAIALHNHTPNTPQAGLLVTPGAGVADDDGGGYRQWFVDA